MTIARAPRQDPARPLSRYLAEVSDFCSTSDGVGAAQKPAIRRRVSCGISQRFKGGEAIVSLSVRFGGECVILGGHVPVFPLVDYCCKQDGEVGTIGKDGSVI